ncbi:MAG TPA: MAC/perforin domain-containing protein, partial [Actinomycetota bacterium]|nr:MAC/perforin domain-containing protein [Actinomycetota bacterium]
MSPRRPLEPIPGLDAVGRGMFIRPGQPHYLREVIFKRTANVAYRSAETGLVYGVPETYAVDSSPPMPSSEALNKTLLADSWERFEKQTSVDASLTVSRAPFSLDLTVHQTAQLRQEEDCYYAMRTSFVPLWSVYIPTAHGFPDAALVEDLPVPFSHANRTAYARIFERFGSHYVRRAWVGGKASLVFTIRKSTSMSRSEIMAGLKASLPVVGGGNVSTEDHRTREKLQSSSHCTVLGQGGTEVKLAALSTLDDSAYNDWLETVRLNPEVIELEAEGIWTLIQDEAKAQALMEAYKEETVFAPFRVVFNLDYVIHLLRDEYYSTYDLNARAASKPLSVRARWPQLFDVGFDRVDSAFLGRHLTSAAGEDLDRKLFFFNRDVYVRWDVDRGAIDPGYPRQIVEGWPGVTFNRVDAVVNVSPDALYFFRGPEYIRFNAVNNHADPGYPDAIAARWAGVTFDRLDSAAYFSNGQAYFFRGNEYIRYDTVLWRADPGYP